jgi:peptidyl-prolyl cis-trans isomerase D
MLKTFRSKLTSWLMLGFLALAVIAIVVTGFGTDGMGGLPSGGARNSGETLAEVGGDEIQSSELEQLIRRRLSDMQRENPEIGIAQLLNAGVYESLLDQIIVRRALWAFGRENGVVVSDAMIDRMIVSVPTFHNLAGQFDNEIYRRWLEQAGITEQQVRREIAYDLMERQLQVPIALSVAPPESVVAQYGSLMLEQRRGLVAEVPIAALAQGIAPSDAEIAAFYARNRARYTVPERRVLRYALVSREQAAAGARATDEEIAAFYRQNQARYAGTETRNLLQIVLPDEAAARTFVSRAAGGANFIQAAQQAQRSARDVTLGAQNRQQFTNVSSPEVANAVFSAARGALVGPIRSPLGWHIVRVESISPAVARPLDAVRGEIRTEIERRKGDEALAAAIARIEDRIAEGLSFEDVARADNLTIVETPPLTAAGAAPGVQWQAPAEVPALVRGAFQVDPEDTEPTIETLAPNQRYAILSVARVVPAAVPPLAEIRDRVRADVVRQQATQRARALADRIVARINGGVPAERALAEAGVRLPAPERVAVRRLDIARRGGQVPPALAALLAVPQGRARVVPGSNGVYVVAVLERIPGRANCPAGQPAAAQQANEGCQAIEGARGDLRRELGGELSEQFARAAQNAVEVRRDEAAIRRARQQLQSNN